MTDTTTDPVATHLAEVRERSKKPLAHVGSLPISHDGVRTLMESAGDVPRLVAAVEAVLAIHAKQDKPVRSWDLNLRCQAHPPTQAIPSFEEIRNCPDCTYREVWVCGYRDCREDEWPCATYAAISAALLGEE